MNKSILQVHIVNTLINLRICFRDKLIVFLIVFFILKVNLYRVK